MTRSRLALGTAAAVALAAGLAGAWWVTRPAGPPPDGRHRGPRLVWAFDAPKPGAVVAAPLVAGDAVYLAAVHARGFQLSGAVYALDPATGKRRWAFDRDDEMHPTASAPLLAGGRLYVGEGMHRNFDCRLYCLDPATGRPHWTFPTADHVEGGAVAAGDAVIFPAGNDGLYAVNVATGKSKWNFRANLHVDSTPAVAGGRVYAGSGPSKRFPDKVVVCLDAATGKPVWRTPAPLPAWSTPVIVGDLVVVGLGNGRLTEPAAPPEVPAGALAAFDVRTGAHRWTVPVGDAVFGRPVVVADRIVFGSRDGNVYGVSFAGREQFRVPLGGPVIAAPAADGGRVYAVAVPGRLVCLDPADGHEWWRHELVRTGTEPHAYAPPVVAGGRLYLAAEARAKGASVGVVTLSCYALPAENEHAGAGSEHP